MKLVGEPPDEESFQPTSETHELVSKFKKHEDNQDLMPKIDNEVTLEEGEDYVPASEHEMSPENLAQEISSEDLVPSVDAETAASTDESQINAQFPEEAPLGPPVDEARLVDREAEVYADKKTISQISDGDSLVVKDICIDESSRFLIKRLVEEIDANEMIPSGIESLTTSANCDLNGLNKDLDCKPVITNNESHESSLCSPEVGNELNTGEQTNVDISHPKISLQQLFLLGESDSGFDGPVPTSHKFSSHDEQISDQKNVKEVTLDELYSTRTLPDMATDSVETGKVDHLTKETPEVSLEDESSKSTTTVTSDLTVLDHSAAKEDFDVTNLEVTNPELKSVTEKTSGSKENTDSPQIAPIQPEETVHDSPKAASRKLLYQDNYADMNLSGPHYLSGPKISSGHIAYSGNISMRSDSSTTSTRSFAFPILQSEWNTSPVKMAKAKRRYFRKHQWLRTGFFCCKF